MEESWHLNVIRSMWCGRVKVSSSPCVYCCLHIDLFPDTSHDLKGIQIPANFASHFNVASGIDKGQIYYTVAMVTLAKPWWRVLVPLGLHRVVAQSGMVAPWGVQCLHIHLACTPPGCPLDRAGHCGWTIRKHRVPFGGLSKFTLTLFWGESGSCGKDEQGVLCLVQVMWILVSGSWRISDEPVRTAYTC